MGDLAFYSTNPNLNMAVNRLNRKQGILSQAASEINNAVSDIKAGSGAVASNETVEAAIQWGLNKIEGGAITYSQSNRNLKNVDGSSYDCSSFIITCFYAVGLNIAATTTSDMKAGFTKAGWTWIPGNTWSASKCKRGDILLKAGSHTQMYIGNNQDMNCGSTPARVVTHSTNNYNRGWDGILRLS